MSFKSTILNGLWIALAIGALSLTPLPAADGQQKNTPALAELQKDLLKVARETMEVLSAEYKVGRGTFESMVEWSPRLLKAELGVAQKQSEKMAAYQAHADRMKAFEEKAKKMREAGFNSPASVLAATYARIEAEIWLEEAKAAK